MKTLLILRHAKSSWNNNNLSDHDRPLNQRGREDAPRMGKLLRQEDIVPDLIISSSAERAMTTAELVALSSGYENKVEVTEHFYLADPMTYIEKLQTLPASLHCVMVVGHNPGMAMLVEELTGESIPMLTAAIAKVSLPIEKWQDLSWETEGTLDDYWIPREAL